MPKRLTKKVVEAETAPGKGAVTVWDDEIRGFGLRVHAGGVKSFFINYRLDGRERRHTIGRYDDWSVQAARDEARELRKKIDRGDDPAGEKRERREAPTMQDLADRYIDDHLPTKTAGQQRKKLAEQRAKDEKRMVAELVERLGKHTKVEDVHAGDIGKMHRDISESISRRTGHPRRVRANRILSIASKMFSLSLLPRAGEDKPWRDQAQGNPCKGVSKNHEDEREHFYSARELAVISDALSEYGSSAQEPGRTVAKAAADAVRLVLFTGCRPSEAVLARWPQFDNEPGFWVKPSAHVKQRKTHKMPLSPPALELLDRLRSQCKDATSLVFPGAVPGEPLSTFSHVWESVRVALFAASKDDKVAAIVTNLEETLGHRPSLNQCQDEAKRQDVTLPDGRLYDLRHTFASVGIGGGLGLPIIGRLLGHTNWRTTQRYAHLADDPAREATNKIGAVIAARPTATVVPLKDGGRHG